MHVRIQIFSLPRQYPILFYAFDDNDYKNMNITFPIYSLFKIRDTPDEIQL